MSLGKDLWNHYSMYFPWYCGVLPQGVLASTGSGMRTVTFYWESWSHSSAHLLLIPFGKVSQVILLPLYRLIFYNPCSSTFKMVCHPSSSILHGLWSSSPVFPTLAIWLFMASLRGVVDVIKYWCQVSAFLNSTIAVNTREPASIYPLLSALAYREPPRPASHGCCVLLLLVLSFSYQERCDCWGIHGEHSIWPL